MKLERRVRGEKGLSGRAQVYFSCHPEDHDLYFDQICGEIFAFQNCEILFDREPEAEYSEEELIALLEGVQLLVIPVTGRFLREKSRAAEVELPYAQKHHIPLLLLPQEKDLDPLFDKRFGNLHLLKRDRESLGGESGLHYEKQLEKFLSSVLTDEVERERIRKGFDHHVFLSYRRGERKQARELIRKLYQEDELRNTAIWYDDFLIPGEDFNMAITQEIDRSDAVILLVTPSLLEGENYVLTVEYPYAREKGKPILPVMVLPTDEEALGEKCKGLGRCIDGRGADQVTAGLRAMLEKARPEKGESGPERDLLIGMAYLYGVDVEVDRAYGIQRITAAAERGLLEAIYQMEKIYRVGIGAAVDQKAALRWQERLVDRLEEKLDEWGQKTGEVPAEDVERWIGELSILADRYMEQFDADGAKAALLRYQGAAEAKAREFGSEDAIRELGHCYGQIGDFLIGKGELAEAEEFCRKSVELFQGLSGEDQDRVSLAGAYRRMGRLKNEWGDLSGAVEYYQKSLAMDEKAWRDAKTPEAGMTLSSTCQSLGQVSVRLGKLGEAGSYFERALELARELFEALRTPEFKAALAGIYRSMGKLFRMEGKLKEAEEYLQQELELRGQLYESEGGIQAESRLAGAYVELADLYQEAGYRKEAKTLYEEGMRLAKGLTEGLGTPEIRSILSACCQRIGALYRKEGDPKQGEAYYLKARDYLLEGGEKDLTVDMRRARYKLCGMLGDVALDLGEREKAKEYYLEGLALCRQLRQETEGTEIEEDLIQLCNNIGGLLPEEDGAVYLREANALSRELAESGGLPQYRHLLGISEFNLGLITEDTDPEKATAHYERSLEQFQALWETNPTPKAAMDLQRVCKRLGRLWMREEDPEKAARYFMECRALFRRIPEEQSSPEDRREMWRDLVDLSALLFDLGREEEGEACLRECRDISAALYDQEGSPEHGYMLAASYYNLAGGEGDDSRKAMLAQARLLAEWLIETDGEDPSYRELYEQITEWQEETE